MPFEAPVIRTRFAAQMQIHGDYSLMGGRLIGYRMNFNC